MRNRVELYINNVKCDLSESTKILFSYKIKDVYNPTIVKNSFSKTIALEGTKTNNEIFNNLYKLDVSYTDTMVNAFNSSKRNPFELYVNGELAESGYMKLDSIKNVDGQITYNITLFGGLGDFLYNLMYDADGNKKTLASLNYIDGSKNELDFRINRDVIVEAWDRLNNESGSTSKWDIINFAPCYNGIDDVIETDKVLVNTNGYTGLMRRWNENQAVWESINGFPQVLYDDPEASGETSGSSYSGRGMYRPVSSGGTDDVTKKFTTHNGYGLVELEKELTEWEIRDLRSYLQRPVIRMKHIINAVCDKDNNGGYDVVLDSDFFNKNNPYFENAWVTLPMFNDLKNKEEIEDTITITGIGGGSGSYRPDRRGAGNTYDSAYNFILSGIIAMNTNSAEFKCRLRLGYLSGATLSNNTASLASTINGERYYAGYALQLVGVDVDGNRVAKSNKYWLTSSLSSSGDYMTASECSVNDSIGTQTFVRDLNKVGDYYEFPEDLTFDMDLNDTNIVGIGLFIEYRAMKGETVRRKSFLTGNEYKYLLFDSKSSLTLSTAGHYGMKEPYLNNLYNYSLKILTGGEGSSILSNSPITKQMLLTTESTPADYLLSYTKLFNLFYDKDPFEKTIYIRTMKNYYNGEKVDIHREIDRQKDISITPLSFDTNTYEMGYKTGDTSTNGEKYLAKYGVNFGHQRINTGYDFDGNVKQIYDGVFTDAVQSLESSRYYTMAQADSANTTPTFLYNTITYKLFNASGESSECSLSKPKGIEETGINKLSTTDVLNLISPYYDAVNKPQFHSDNEPKSGKDCLLFFNGFVQPYKRGDYQAYYTLSDDVQEMITWCDKPCYLWTQSENNIRQQEICKKITNLPNFSRYITTDSTNSIHYSMDLGRTKELYIPDLKYVDGQTCIYERYWQDYLEDLYDIDTRIVEVYVKFDGKVMQDYLKKYWYFDNSYWVISEILDYNPVSGEVTKVKFVKVNEWNVYNDDNQAEMPENIITITVNPQHIGVSGGTVSCTVTVASGVSWFLASYANGLTPAITAGTGTQTFNVAVAANDTGFNRELVIGAHTDHTVSATINQDGPYIDSIFTVTQFAQYTYSNVPSTGGTCLYTVKSNHPWTVVSDREYAYPIQTSGTGNTDYGETIEVHWDPSDSYGTRGMKMTFTNSIGQVIEVWKWQDQIDYDKYYTYLYENSGGTYTVSGMTSGATLETQPTWVTVTDNGDGSYDIVAGKNTGSYRNGDVIFVMENDGVETRVRVQVNQKKGVDDSFKVEPLALNFICSGGTSAITITNEENYHWDIVAKPSWITVSQMSGDSAATVSVVCSANTREERQGSVVVYCTDTKATFIVTITQEGDPDAGDAFKIEPTAIVAESGGGNYTLTLTNRLGDNWEVVGQPVWVSLSTTGGSSDAVITVTAEPNNGEQREGSIVVWDRTTNQTYVIPVIQERNPNPNIFTVEPMSLEYAYSGGTKQITITDTGGNNWRVTSKPEWINLSSTAGTSTTVINAVASLNEGEERQGTIVILDATKDNTYAIVVTQTANPNPVGKFKVEPAVLEYLSGGGYQYITITNPDKHNWRITSTSEWYGFNQSQGNASTTISCFAEVNSGSTTRTSTIEFTDAYDMRKYYVQVIQYSSATTKSITITPNPLSVSEGGGTESITIVYANRSGDFVIPTPSDSGITVGEIVFTGDTAIVDVTIPKNDTENTKTYTIRFDGSGVSGTLTINQAKSDLVVTPEIIHINSKRKIRRITIISTDSWTIN